MIVACEPSGDMQAGALVHAVHERCPQVQVVGVGSQALRQERVTMLYDSSVWGTVGVWQALPRIPSIMRAFQGIKRAILAQRPDLLVVIDSPAINLPLVKFARQHGVKTVYYFPPSQWTENLKRHRYIASVADDVVVAFRFTADRYREAGLNPVYFGHPLLDVLDKVPDRSGARQALQVPQQGTYVGLLPGSRTQEIDYLLPVFLQAARRLVAQQPDLRFLIPVANPALRPRIDRLLTADLPTTLVEGQGRLVMAASNVLMTCSGTATLEAAVLGIPMVIAYRLPWLDYRVGKLLPIKVRWFGLPNLVMQKTLVPELLQNQVTPERVAAQVGELLQDSDKRRIMEEELAGVKKALGFPGAVAAVADLIVEKLALGPTRHRHHHE
jgi:lipid-A-disaccharide synthase